MRRSDEQTRKQLQTIIYLTLLPALTLTIAVIALIKPARLEPNAFVGCYNLAHGPTIKLDPQHLVIADDRQPSRAVTYMFDKAYDLHVSGPSFTFRTDAQNQLATVNGSEEGQIVHLLSSPRAGRKCSFLSTSGLSRCPDQCAAAFVRLQVFKGREHRVCSPLPLAGEGWVRVRRFAAGNCSSQIGAVPIRRPNPHARLLRREATDVERRFWLAVRNRRLGGFKFRREATIGPFIVDFLYLERRLIVELDGGQHGDEADRRRQAWLEAQGYTVLRFRNNEVLENWEGTLEMMLSTLTALPAAYVRPSPNPLPRAGEG